MQQPGNRKTLNSSTLQIEFERKFISAMGNKVKLHWRDKSGPERNGLEANGNARDDQ